MDAEAWKKRYQREKTARKAAESIAEEKTREIFFRNQELTKLAASLEEAVKERTSELEEKNINLEEHRDKLKKQREMLQEANQALEEKAAELEKISRYKSEFLANVSHELRTPLNSTIILSKLMVENAEGSLSAEDQQSISIIYNNANELLEIIEDILDMSKVQAGELSIHMEDVSIRELCQALEDQFRPLADEKSQQFSIDVDENLGEWINTDRKRLKQILKNLLSNACKFTPEKGQVKLRVFKDVWNPDTDYTSESLNFSVSDTGIGIPLDKQKTVFQMFKQADGSTSRQYGGTGLGLAICRKLADLMDSQLTLVSDQGQGATFTLSLPPGSLLPDIDEHRSLGGDSQFFINADEFEPEEGVEFNEETVLLVDDDLRNSFALSQLLQKYGLKVLLSENGKQALDLMETERQVDLVLLDLMMPTMDGFAMLEQLRGRYEYRMLPVIMLTASTDDADEKRCRLAGADDYLTKPVAVSELLDCLNRWLSV
ncbi:ATP-binding protein [Endozoicomonas montiporae]|uniref:histidine kinase n=1 Tax=Endozoicomonas montiporae CL-33 TaxID=570277 RepID=A0A142BCL1_9GAMM|nr:ATP-binding protein [Endozoicomonas montiporae]AMO56487.1 signal transduction histidine kinase [Endozoicomonas montiporae CL-33]